LTPEAARAQETAINEAISKTIMKKAGVKSILKTHMVKLSVIF